VRVIEPIFERSFIADSYARRQRFVLAEAVQRTALRFQERLIEAARAADPQPSLHQADTDLTKLRFYLRLCRDLELMSLDQYGHAARMVDEVGRLLDGWIKSSSS